MQISNLRDHNLMNYNTMVVPSLLQRFRRFCQNLVNFKKTRGFTPPIFYNFENKNTMRKTNMKAFLCFFFTFIPHR